MTMTDMCRLPGLVVIGAQKAGTSWLHQNLAKHPNIWVPPFKELHFFDHKFIKANRSWTSGHVDRGVNRALVRRLRAGTLDDDYLSYLRTVVRRPLFNRAWYQSVFAACPDDCIGVDVTPEYCCIPERGVRFFREFLPDTKISYVIRHPVARALSQIRMNARRRGLALKTPADWIDLAKDPVVSHRGDYEQYIPIWDNVIGRDKIMYLKFSEIRDSPKSVMATLEGALNLRSFEYKNLANPIHATSKSKIPDDIYEYLENMLRAQIRFLRSRFGTAFVSSLENELPHTKRKQHFSFFKTIMRH